MGIKVTRYGRGIVAETIGWDPAAQTEDLPSPVDRAGDAAITIPINLQDEVTLVQHKTATSNNTTGNITATFDDPVSALNLLVAYGTIRSTLTGPASTPTGWTKIGEVNSGGDNNGCSVMYYKFASGTETGITLAWAANYKRLTVAEFAGVTDFDDFVLADEGATATSYPVGSVDTANATGLVTGIVHVAHEPVTFTPVDLTEIEQGKCISFGPTHLTAWEAETVAGTYSWTPTSGRNDTWAGILAAFSASTAGLVWVAVDNVNDGDDATFELPAEEAECLRADLGTAYVIASSRLRIGTETAGSKTYEIEAGNEADYSDAVTLDSVTFTGTGSYTAQDVNFSWAPTTAYRYWRVTGPAESRVFYEWELFEIQADISAHVADPTDAHDASAISYDNTTSGLTADDVQAAIDELDAAIASAGYVTVIEGGGETLSTVAASGATETIDLTNGNVHDITLTADCTFTFAAVAGGAGRSFTLILRQDGTGGWTPTWPVSVVWGGGSAPTIDDTADAVSVLTFVTLDGGTVWYGFATGGGGGGTPATTVEDETTFGISPAVGTDTEYARQDHTHGTPDDAAIMDLGRWEIVMEDGTSAPPVPLTNEAEDDWLYAWVAG